MEIFFVVLVFVEYFFVIVLFNKMIDFIQKETQYKVALLVLVIFCLVETLAFLIYLSISQTRLNAVYGKMTSQISTLPY